MTRELHEMTVSGIDVVEGRHAETNAPYWEFTHPRSRNRMVLLADGGKLTIWITTHLGDAPYADGAHDVPNVVGDAQAWVAAHDYLGRVAEGTA